MTRSWRALCSSRSRCRRASWSSWMDGVGRDRRRQRSRSRGRDQRRFGHLWVESRFKPHTGCGRIKGFSQSSVAHNATRETYTVLQLRAHRRPISTQDSTPAHLSCTRRQRERTRPSNLGTNTRTPIHHTIFSHSHTAPIDRFVLYAHNKSPLDTHT